MGILCYYYPILFLKGLLRIFSSQFVNKYRYCIVYNSKIKILLAGRSDPEDHYIEALKHSAWYGYKKKVYL